MEFKTHLCRGKTISEACGDRILVANPQDAAALLEEALERLARD